MRSNAVIARIAAIAAIAAASFAPAAHGQASSGGGVHVDPNSPAGTEYDIPIDRARRESQGGHHGGNGSLFGAGVKPDKSSKGKGHKKRGHHRKSAKHPATSAAAGPTIKPPPGQLASSPSNPSSSGGSGTLVLVGGIAIVLVALATCGGWAVRRRSA